MQYFDPYKVQISSFWFTQFDGEMKVTGNVEIGVEIFDKQLEHNFAQNNLNDTPFM